MENDSRYAIRNKGKKIGRARVNKKNIRKIRNRRIKFGMGALLTAGLVFVGLSKLKSDGSELELNTQTAAEDFLQSNDIFRADLFMIPQENGDIHFVTSEYLDEHNYVPNDTIDTRYDFIVDFNDDLNDTYRAAYPHKDFSQFDHDYQLFRTIYEEYIDGDQKDSFFQQQYLMQVEENLIELIHSYKLASYVPTAIPYEEYVATTYPQTEDKYTINYEIPKDSTLSEIISYADNNQEYKETYEEVLNNPNNNISNPDLIYAGETLELPNLDQGDLEDLGYEIWTNPADELDQRYLWINEMLPTIDYLSGDVNSLTNLQNLRTTVELFNKSYDAYTGGDLGVSLDIVYDARQICDTIYLLTGEQFMPTPQKVR
jgi:hypothetical protein